MTRSGHSRGGTSSERLKTFQDAWLDQAIPTLPPESLVSVSARELCEGEIGSYSSSAIMSLTHGRRGEAV